MPAMFSCLAVYVAFGVILLAGPVVTDKMEPDISQGSYIVGNRLAYINASPQVGDTVMAEIDDKCYIRTISKVEDGICILQDANNNEMTVDTENIIAKMLN